MKSQFYLPLFAFAATPFFLSAQENASDHKDPAIKDVEKIEVVGKRNQALTEPTAETQQLLNVAGIAGDPLAAVFSLPGIVYSGGDDGGEPAIRGSSPDDNAFFIDGLPADYIFHLFGDSIFNKNLVRDFSLESAAFGASHGNAIGGVFDVSLRDPKNQDITTTLDMSMIKSSLLVEGGLSDNVAFYGSYRRSQIHLFLNDGEEIEDDVNVYQAPESDDYQAKLQWLLADNQKLTLSLNGASDSGGINIGQQSEWGRANPDVVGDLSLSTSFSSAGVQWQYYGDGQTYASLLLGQVSSKQTEKIGQGQFQQVEADKNSLRGLYQTRLAPKHLLTIGADITAENINYSYDLIPYYCTENDADCNDFKGDRIQDTDEFKQQDMALYITDRWQLSDTVDTEIGLRAERNDYTDQTFVHPRIAINWQASELLRLTAKAGTYSRFPDVDKVVRKIGNPALKSPESQHVALKADYEINDEWKTSLELYYKTMDELPASVEADENSNESLRYVNAVSGTAYGVEWVLEKSLSDNWYGWASLSWSKSDRTDDRTNVTTEYYLDTPLILNLVANYNYNEKWDFGIRFTGRSGAKYTPITGIEENPDHPGYYIPTYGALNSETLPFYHRLDIQADYKTTVFGRDAVWTFALLNALNASNVSGYYFAPDGNETPDNYIIEEEKGMEIFPSIGFQMSF